MRFRRFFPAILFLLASPLQARIWTVEADGSGDAPTIQAAIDSASSGDEVSVQPGTYLENIDFLGKDLWVHGAMGPAATVIDGGDRDSSVVTIQSGETRAARLEGFTIRGGKGQGTTSIFKQGGGIFVWDASPELIGNTVIDNSAVGWGGGISLRSTTYGPPVQHPLVRGNRFENNWAGVGGGAIHVGEVEAEVYDNIFVGNETDKDGGAIYMDVSWRGGFHVRGNQFWENVAEGHGGAIAYGIGRLEPLLVEWNLFVRNEARGTTGPWGTGSGGAISILGDGGIIRNNTFAGNVATGGEGCTGGAILVSSEIGIMTIENNLFYGQAGCAMTCRIHAIFGTGGADGAEVRHNLFWQNSPGDIITPDDCSFGVVEDNFFEDPLLCGPEMDNYTVGVDSPALSASPIIGVWLNPGCGPGVPIESSTWGRLKLRFRD